MEKLFICPICGGRLKIKIDSGMALCGSCGEWTEADPAQLQNLRDTVGKAERSARLQTAEGCAHALRLLEEISAVADVEERIAACRAQMDSVQETRIRQTKTARDDDRRETATGTALIVLLVLICLAVLGGAISVFVLWSRGILPPSTALAIVCVVVAVTLLVVLSKK